MPPEETELAYHPNMKEEGESLYCFKDMARACGPDCVAYDLPPPHSDFKGKAWARCTLLVNSHRTGKHLVVLADAMHRITQYLDDAQRMNQPPPPRPR